jgi:hypothetical protein
VKKTDGGGGGFWVEEAREKEGGKLISCLVLFQLKWLFVFCFILMTMCHVSASDW